MRALGMPIGAGAPVAGGSQVNSNIWTACGWAADRGRGARGWWPPSKLEYMDPPADGRPIGAAAPMAGVPQLIPTIRIRLRWVSRSGQACLWLAASKLEYMDPPADGRLIGAAAPMAGFHN